MNLVEARATLAGLIQEALADYPDLYVGWDNAGGIDLFKAGDMALRIDFYWDDASQIELSSKPHQRTAGTVWFIVFSREGSGVSKSLALADHLRQRLSFRNRKGLVTRALKPHRRSRQDGWQSQEWRLPFFFDSIDKSIDVT